MQFEGGSHAMPGTYSRRSYFSGIVLMTNNNGEPKVIIDD